MSTLPKLETPKYTCTVPSTGETVEFRPFLVGEEKVLLMANQSQDQVEIQNAIIDVLNTCFLDNIDSKKLKPFDIDYLFVQLRMKSVGEVSELKYSCKNKVPVEDTVREVDTDENVRTCDGEIEYSLDLSRITVDIQETEKIIQLDEKNGVGAKIVFPSMEDMVSVSNMNDEDARYEIIISSIGSIFTGEEVIDPREVPKKEVYEFIDNMPRESIQEIRDFMDTMPQAKVTINTHCPKCGNEEEFEAAGLKNFF